MGQEQDRRRKGAELQDTPKRVLAFDQATATGWASINTGLAALDLGELHPHGKYRLEVDRFSGRGMSYLRYEAWLREMIKLAAPDAIAFEEIHAHGKGGTATAHLHGALTALIQKVADENGIPYTGIPVGTWKKYATGKGNASKDAVKAAFKRQYPAASDRTQDEIDAFFIGLTLAKQLGWYG